MTETHIVQNDSAPSRLAYIDGLRGIAALSVFLIHSGGFGLRQLGAFCGFLVDYGKYGVTLFFVLSAFTLANSAQNEARKYEKPSWGAYFIRRIFRICPLYFFIVTVLYFFGQASLKSLLLHLSFINVFMLDYANDILDVEWSIIVEAMFYIIFPVIYILSTRSFRYFILFFAISFLLYDQRDLIAQHMLPPEYFEHRSFTIFWYLNSFMFGILAFLAAQRLHGQEKSRGKNLFQNYGILFVMAGLFLCIQSREGMWSQMAIAFLSCLAIVSGFIGGKFTGFMKFKALTYCGKISFSIYLVHKIVLKNMEILWGEERVMMIGISGLLLTLLISSLTYKYIEAPGIEFGRRIGKKIRTSGPQEVQPEAA